MTLPPFELHRPQTVEEATELASRYGEDAAFYCGGTELLLLLKLGFASFGHLVDLKRDRGARRHAGGERRPRHRRDGHASRARAVASSCAERLPALAAMERRVANVRVRTGRNARRQPLLLRPALRSRRRSSSRSTRRSSAGAAVSTARRVPIARLRRRPVPDEPRRRRVADVAFTFPRCRRGAVSPTRSSPSTSAPRRPSRAARASQTASSPRRALPSARSARSRCVAASAEAALTGMPIAELDPGRISEAGERAAVEAAPVDDATGSADVQGAARTRARRANVPGGDRMIDQQQALDAVDGTGVHHPRRDQVRPRTSRARPRRKGVREVPL